MSEPAQIKTIIRPVDARKIGRLQAVPNPGDLLDELEIELDEHSEDGQSLRRAAEQLRSSNIPVSFPTETVYGLGADATRSAAVKGIYKAKQRPSDNPLIVHFASLNQLRAVLRSRKHANGHTNGCNGDNSTSDPIPDIYKPLIKKFWPGPLTIILPNPPNSPLAPEVTAGLSTFGARIPRHVLALALIKLADVPVAAPSANASTKPSPTAAEHVAYDLDGRIETIIDGGPCDVGVESTVVDGLSQPPLVLRPGGISVEQLQSCPGWENTQIGYKNATEADSQPRAPGMKYRHYSPKAPVVLFEAGKEPPSVTGLQQFTGPNAKLGLVRTKSWRFNPKDDDNPISSSVPADVTAAVDVAKQASHFATGFAGLLDTVDSAREPKKALQTHVMQKGGLPVTLLDISLGPDTAGIARGVFAALRELDSENVDAILVEGIDDAEGETAAAIMNRLRKAAELNIAK
ncbi:hypothetical protein LTR36_003686 [Oleoguttula mirabilis]|uniref:Threonylcarbamoyl-AMP synthase n=1 Tax=Oleoguttula mirabilis TaxID=1507867 RepID=A0AAV9JIC8_9PEZI|nr:hypothetical protein LTR36_003686 [Oleoguttula mirabilis]